MNCYCHHRHKNLHCLRLRINLEILRDGTGGSGTCCVAVNLLVRVVLGPRVRGQPCSAVVHNVEGTQRVERQLRELLAVKTLTNVPSPHNRFCWHLLNGPGMPRVEVRSGLSAARGCFQDPATLGSTPSATTRTTPPETPVVAPV